MRSFIISILLLNTSLFAQPSGGIYNNNAKIVITSGIKLLISGGTNSDYYATGASSAIDLDGELKMEGDFLNSSGTNSFINIDTDGWVRFEGTTANSSVTGTNTFENFQMNRSTTSVATISSDLTVNSQLDLDAGIVTTSNNKVIMSSTTAADLLSYSSTGFINGNLQRGVASNVSTYVFPIGVGTATTNYHQIDFVNNNLTGVSNIVGYVAYEAKSGDNTDSILQSNTNAYDGITSGTTQMGSIVEKTAGNALQWDLTPNASPNGGDYGVKLYFNSFTSSNFDADSDNKFSILKRPSNSTSYADWDAFASTTSYPDAGAAGRIFSSGYAEKEGFAGFSKFVIAKSANNALPIELIDFSSECRDNSIILKWSTASEKNNEFFTIEKSDDAINFYEISVIAGSKNSNEIKNYEYITNESTAAYFRLKQTDFDRTESHSKIISADACNSQIQEESIAVFTANNNNIIIQIKSPIEKTYNISLMDQSGRLVIDAKKYSIFYGNNTFKIHPGQISTGIYILTFQNEVSQHAEKIFIR